MQGACCLQNPGFLSEKMVLLQLLLLFLGGSLSANAGSPLVPAYFVIGDSLVDPGNNNYLLTLAKSNFDPYGMQFDTRMPTGRFTNGRVTVDFIASLLGLPLPPAYLDPSTKGFKLLQGVNFASAGCGIIDSTGNIFVGRVPFSEQVTQLGDVKKSIASLIGQGAAEKLISSSIVTVILGSNDYINNYVFKVTAESKLPPDQFQNLLISTYVTQIKKLYNLGVRKLAVYNIPTIGCIPRSLAFYGSINGECIDFINNYAINFNKVFKPTVLSLGASLPGLHLTHVDSYRSFGTLYNNPGAYGFIYNSEACCGIGRFRGAIQCPPHFPSCPDYDQRLFFDSFHPTARANSFTANFTVFGGRDISDPFNLLQLAQL